MVVVFGGTLLNDWKDIQTKILNILPLLSKIFYLSYVMCLKLLRTVYIYLLMYKDPIAIPQSHSSLLFHKISKTQMWNIKYHLRHTRVTLILSVSVLLHICQKSSEFKLSNAIEIRLGN